MAFDFDLTSAFEPFDANGLSDASDVNAATATVSNGATTVGQ